MHPLLILQLLVLLTVANGMPVVVKKICGDRFAQPLDGGIRFADGRPMFGRSKTIRGILVSVAATTAAAPLLGLGASIGLLFGALAMLGDVFSSFLKRRFGLQSSDRATGIDQIPEALFPLLGCRFELPLTALDIALCVAAFFVGEIVGSRLLHRIGLRDRPY